MSDRLVTQSKCYLGEQAFKPSIWNVDYTFNRVLCNTVVSGVYTIVYFKYQVGCYIECFMRGDIFPHNLQADFDFRWLCCGLTKYWGWRNNWVKINWDEVKVKCNCWGINLDGLSCVLTKIRGPWIFALEEKMGFSYPLSKGVFCFGFVDTSSLYFLL